MSPFFTLSAFPVLHRWHWCLSALWPERNIYTLDASEMPFSKNASRPVCSVPYAKRRQTQIFTLLSVHWLVVCISVRLFCAFVEYFLLTFFSFLSLSIFYFLFHFNLFLHFYLFIFSSFLSISCKLLCCLLECFLLEVPQHRHCISITMSHVGSLKKLGLVIH